MKQAKNQRCMTCGQGSEAEDNAVVLVHGHRFCLKCIFRQQLGPIPGERTVKLKGGDLSKLKADKKS